MNSEAEGVVFVVLITYLISLNPEPLFTSVVFDDAVFILADLFEPLTAPIEPFVGAFGASLSTYTLTEQSAVLPALSFILILSVFVVPELYVFLKIDCLS